MLVAGQACQHRRFVLDGDIDEVVGNAALPKVVCDTQRTVTTQHPLPGVAMREPRIALQVFLGELSDRFVKRVRVKAATQLAPEFLL